MCPDCPSASGIPAILAQAAAQKLWHGSVAVMQRCALLSAQANGLVLVWTCFVVLLLGSVDLRWGVKSQ